MVNLNVFSDGYTEIPSTVYSKNQCTVHCHTFGAELVCNAKRCVMYRSVKTAVS